jgi:uncharacterized protein YjiS (DUF1127 family)
MDARSTKTELGDMLPFPPTREAQEVEAIRLAAAEARDAEVAGGFRRFLHGIGAVFVAIATWPRRQALLEELNALTDRELADIGLHRGDLARVFEPVEQVPANEGRTPAYPSATYHRAA